MRKKVEKPFLEEKRKLKMGRLKVFALVLFLVAISVRGPEQLVSAQTHHVVGGEEGWNSASDISSWLSGRVSGLDTICVITLLLFASGFSVPATEDSIVELHSLEELATCDLQNPIRMYSDRSNHVILDKEGTTYFSSGNLENSKNGMKLPVTVQNRHDDVEPYPHPPPTTSYPAATATLNVFSFLVFSGLYLSCISM